MWLHWQHVSSATPLPAAWWHWDLSATVRQSKALSGLWNSTSNVVCCPSFHHFPVAAEGPSREWMLQCGWMQISSHTDIHRWAQEKKIQDLGQRVYHNTVASSLAMHNAWEHANTLFRICINDHGETRSLSTRAINKRCSTDKGPYLPRLQNPPPSTTTWSTETHFMPILNLVLFLCCLGVWCSSSRAE